MRTKSLFSELVYSDAVQPSTKLISLHLTYFHTYVKNKSVCTMFDPFPPFLSFIHNKTKIIFCLVLQLYFVERGFHLLKEISQH